MWQREFSIETSASPETIWKLFEDVPGWKKWNAGIEQISMAEPFAEGAQFIMQPPGQPELTSKLIKVRENEVFEDETIVDDIRVVVAHQLTRLRPNLTRITYAAKVTGPAAEEIGTAVTSDFPDVLKSLASLAERTEP